MSGRSLLSLLPMLLVACTRPAEAPPPQPPPSEAAEAQLEGEGEGEGEPAAEPSEDDFLDELRSEPSERPAAERPEPLEVVVDAVMTEENPDATLIEVGADARFTVFMKIESVEPETPLLVPGPYAVRLHSPSKTFRGPVPKKGKRVQFHLSIFPEDPSDPHDETFFADLWID